MTFSQPLTNEVLSIKDSDVQRCDFRGTVTDGTTTLQVTRNYLKGEGLVGSTVTFENTNNCNFVLLRAY